MKPSFQFMDHTADVLFKAQAPSLEKLFEQCALALEQTQVDVSLVLLKITRTIALESKSIEGLLFDFLNELLFYKDSEQLIFARFKITILRTKEGFNLTSTVTGEKLDVKRHNPKVDVKAITMHLFEIKKLAKGWQVTVLVDV